MKNTLLSFLLLVFVLHLAAQGTDSTINVMVRNGHVYEGILLEDIKDVYVQLKGADNKTYTLTYGTIREIKNKKGETLFAQELPPLEVPKPIPIYVPASWADSLYTNDKRYASFNKAWLIKYGDTLPIKVEAKEDYACRNKEAYRLGSRWIETVGKSGDSWQMFPNESPELVVLYGFGTTRYIYSPDSSIDDLLKIVVEGKYQLLSHKYNRLMSKVGNNTGLVGALLADVLGSGTGPDDAFFVYYDGLLKDISDGIKGTLKRSWLQCPQLQSKLNKNKYEVHELKEIVEIANSCPEVLNTRE